ncbi:MAG: carboxypeptidase-like regulatory domain-containing protein, partial [Marinoscillum sp.]
MNQFLTLQIKAHALSMMLLLVMALPLSVFGQDRAVSGQVVDIGGEALPGVTVLVKGTTNGTITDVDGNYKLSVSSGDVISFSFVGFATNEQEVGN